MLFCAAQGRKRTADDNRTRLTPNSQEIAT